MAALKGNKTHLLIYTLVQARYSRARCGSSPARVQTGLSAPSCFGQGPDSLSGGLGSGLEVSSQQGVVGRAAVSSCGVVSSSSVIPAFLTLSPTESCLQCIGPQLSNRVELSSARDSQCCFVGKGWAQGTEACWPRKHWV